MELVIHLVTYQNHDKLYCDRRTTARRQRENAVIKHKKNLANKNSQGQACAKLGVCISVSELPSKTFCPGGLREFEKGAEQGK